MCGSGLRYVGLFWHVLHTPQHCHTCWELTCLHCRSFWRHSGLFWHVRVIPQHRHTCVHSQHVRHCLHADTHYWHTCQKRPIRLKRDLQWRHLDCEHINMSNTICTCVAVLRNGTHLSKERPIHVKRDLQWRHFDCLHIDMSNTL